MLVRAFFSDGGLSAGLAKANAGLTQLSRTGPGARAGLRAVEIGARQLAFSAAGLSGGIGQLARGLLMFGGGSALMLGATAGIGALALAYRHFTRDSRAAADAQKKLRDELARTAQAARDARTPESQRIGAQIGGNQPRFDELNRLIAARQSEIAALVPSQQFIHETEQEALTRLLAGDKELNALYRERRALGNDITAARLGAADAAGKEADAERRLAEERRAARLELIQFQAMELAVFRQDMRPRTAEQRTLALMGAQFGAFGQQSETTPLGFAAPGQAATFENIRKNQPRFVAPDTPKSPSNLMGNLQAMQMMTMSLALGAQAGGVGGALTGLGGFASGAAGISGISSGLAGVLGPAGLVASAVGGVFSIFDNSQERRHKEMLRAFERLGKEVGLERVTVVFTGADGHQVRRSLAQLEDSDAVERIPGPTGAHG